MNNFKNKIKEDEAVREVEEYEMDRGVIESLKKGWSSINKILSTYSLKKSRHY